MLASVAVGVAHQLWIVVFWRLELLSGAVSRRLGPRGFTVYATGFVALITSRLLSIIILASEPLAIGRCFRYRASADLLSASFACLQVQ